MHSVLIRSLVEEDAKTSYKWRNDPEVWRFTGNRPPNEITYDVELAWIQKVRKESNSFRFAILVDNTYVGNIQITNITKEGVGEYHIFIGEKSYWGAGVATLATYQLIRFIKERLQLKRLYLFVNPENIPAIRVYEKCGFLKVSDEIKMVYDLNKDLIPMVSVFMMTYNHEAYINKAIESILHQKTSFDFEIVIGEDCSVDKTRRILKDIADKYPGKFKLLLHDRNIGAVANQMEVFSACSGQYFAICEGDDYWTDPTKLQKQVNFLENNPKYSAVGHQSTIIYENFPGKTELFFKYSKDTLTKKDIIYSNNFHTSAVLFRKAALERFYSKNSIPLVDHSIFILISQSGPFKVFPEIMSVYRRHDSGAAGTSTPSKAYPGQIEWLHEVKRMLGCSFFWGYHFLSSKVHVYYALNHPQIFIGGSLKKSFYFFKYAFLTVIMYPRNIRTIFRLVPDILRIYLKDDKTVPTV